MKVEIPRKKTPEIIPKKVPLKNNNQNQIHVLGVKLLKNELFVELL